MQYFPSNFKNTHICAYFQMFLMYAGSIKKTKVLISENGHDRIFEDVASGPWTRVAVPQSRPSQHLSLVWNLHCVVDSVPFLHPSPCFPNWWSATWHVQCPESGGAQTRTTCFVTAASMNRRTKCKTTTENQRLIAYTAHITTIFISEWILIECL